jgi:hypothetical protein
MLTKFQITILSLGLCTLLGCPNNAINDPIGAETGQEKAPSAGTEASQEKQVPAADNQAQSVSGAGPVDDKEPSKDWTREDAKHLVIALTILVPNLSQASVQDSLGATLCFALDHYFIGGMVAEFHTTIWGYVAYYGNIAYDYTIGRLPGPFKAPSRWIKAFSDAAFAKSGHPFRDHFTKDIPNVIKNYADSEWKIFSWPGSLVNYVYTGLLSRFGPTPAI